MLINCVKSVKFSTQITPKKGTNAMLSRCRQRFEFAWGYHLKDKDMTSFEASYFFV